MRSGTGCAGGAGSSPGSDEDPSSMASGAPCSWRVGAECGVPYLHTASRV
jgi:hypothetical protein